MEFTDKILKCAGCGTEFVFSAGEQAFFHERNFENEPRRCKMCRQRRSGGPQRYGHRPPRPDVRVTCADCGASTTVPFQPVQGRPVRCRECFKKAQVSA